jgi:hypothetical protein
MSWFILKDRRHLGPFQESQLKKYFQRKEITSQDFLISSEKADRGELVYVSVGDCFPSWAQGSPDNSQKSKTQVPKMPEKPSRRLGSFSEEEILKSEVSRVFMESLDSVDLMKGTHELTKTGVTRTGTLKKPPKPPTLSRLSVAPQGLESSEFDAQDAKTRKKWHPVAVGLSFVFMFLVLATFPFLDKSAQLRREPSSVKSKSTETQNSSDIKMPTQVVPSSRGLGVKSQNAGPISDSPVIKVPELTDERSRRLDMERERELEKRDRERSEEYINRDKPAQSADPSSLDKGSESELEGQSERENSSEDPKLEDENSEIMDDENPVKKTMKKTPPEVEENI